MQLLRKIIEEYRNGIQKSISIRSTRIPENCDRLKAAAFTRIPRLPQKTKESLIPEVSTRLFFSPPPSLSTRRSIEENQSFTYLQGGKLYLPLLLRFEVMDGSLPPSPERVYHEARVWDGEGGKEGRAR